MHLTVQTFKKTPKGQEVQFENIKPTSPMLCQDIYDELKAKYSQGAYMVLYETDNLDIKILYCIELETNDVFVITLLML